MTKQSIFTCAIMLASAISVTSHAGEVAQLGPAKVETHCGTFKDSGDNFALVDGPTEVYVEAGDLRAPKDPKKIEGYLWKSEPWGKCYCISGTTNRYKDDRVDYTYFTELMSLKACKEIIR